MVLQQIADVDFEDPNHPWTFVFYYCSKCRRSLMVSRTTEVVRDKEGRI
jgi:hypothetical protein